MGMDTYQLHDAGTPKSSPTSKEIARRLSIDARIFPVGEGYPDKNDMESELPLQPRILVVDDSSANRLHCL